MSGELRVHVCNDTCAECEYASRAEPTGVGGVSRGYAVVSRSAGSGCPRVLSSGDNTSVTVPGVQVYEVASWTWTCSDRCDRHGCSCWVQRSIVFIVGLFCTLRFVETWVFHHAHRLFKCGTHHVQHLLTRSIRVRTVHGAYVCRIHGGENPYQFKTLGACSAVDAPCSSGVKSFSRAFVSALLRGVLVSGGKFVSHVAVSMEPVRRHAEVRDSRHHDIELNPGPASMASDVLTLRANIGCALLCYDVRAVLTASGLPSNEIDAVFQRYTNNVACVQYHEKFTSGVILPLGTSAAKIAQAFRAVYIGPIRCKFVEWLRVDIGKQLDTSVLLGFPLHSSITGDLSSCDIAEEINQYPDEVVTGLLPDMILPGSTQVDTTTMVLYDGVKSKDGSYHFCDTCQFQVRSEGHAARCRKVDVRSADALQSAAWIGDAAHVADIRALVLLWNIPAKQRTITQAKFTAGVAQAVYISCSGHAKQWGAAPNASAHELSTMFEAQYREEFRQDYLVYVAHMLSKVGELWNVHPQDFANITATYFDRK